MVNSLVYLLHSSFFIVMMDLRTENFVTFEKTMTYLVTTVKQFRFKPIFLSTWSFANSHQLASCYRSM